MQVGKTVPVSGAPLPATVAPRVEGGNTGNPEASEVVTTNTGIVVTDTNATVQPGAAGFAPVQNPFGQVAAAAASAGKTDPGSAAGPAPNGEVSAGPGTGAPAAPGTDETSTPGRLTWDVTLDAGVRETTTTTPGAGGVRQSRGQEDEYAGGAIAARRAAVAPDAEGEGGQIGFDAAFAASRTTTTTTQPGGVAGEERQVDAAGARVTFGTSSNLDRQRSGSGQALDNLRRGN